MSNYAAVVSRQRSAEVFAEVRKIQHLLTKDFERHDDRQELFKQQLLRETRKHHQCICEGVCAASSSMSAAAASALLLAQHDVSSMTSGGGSTSDPTLEQSGNAEEEGKVKAQLKQLRGSGGTDQTHIWDGLKNLYTPPDATTGIICDACFAFRGASLVQELPAPWQEFACENEPKKHYYYHSETRQVLWRPPPSTQALSLLVFERTNSVFTVCHCKPSHDRRRRLMQQFREHAHQTTATKAEKRDRQLRGAFSSLSISLMKTKPQ